MESQQKQPLLKNSQILSTIYDHSNIKNSDLETDCKIQ